MKVTIKEWNTVATWRWDIPEDDVCGICQVHFDGTCPTCKYPGDDCSLLSGKCGHNFHMVSLQTTLQHVRTAYWNGSSRKLLVANAPSFEWVDQLNDGAPSAD
ncbi:hypothetical protein E4U42_005746 [Claviceps africana]|uniref:Anaphase-promoting complex subunit 11 RING-H2 finger domain-containing protein n=1 Tax=Claviceps africana TaxID=83212 RepID=A0A8K0JE57_9HYPO|nr:hypothetical protein E4U42_005746 [Claviceps africana]